jgi:3'(2'), 5'-bisphosphate nucleotidase
MLYFYQEPAFIYEIIDIIRNANTILRNERSPTMKIEVKTDPNGRKSKVTSGDIKSNDYIVDQLKAINERLIREHIGNYNIISEEIVEEAFDKRNNSYIDGSWLVDPLDGTADYCNFELEKPCYTANIGLVVDGNPVFGIFSVPETGVIYYGIQGIGSFKIDDENLLEFSNDYPDFPGNRIFIDAKDLTKPGVRVAVSASHMNHDTKEFVDSQLKDVTCFPFASSLKLGAVADGTVDIYPRCGPTYEWDTCAADAVVRFAGGGVYIYEKGKPLHEYKNMLKYNKENLLNPYFVVF